MNDKTWPNFLKTALSNFFQLLYVTYCFTSDYNILYEKNNNKKEKAMNE